MRWTVVLGIAALFVGGLLGGLLGTVLIARGPTPDPGTGATPPAARSGGEVVGAELTVALATLTRELQRLRDTIEAGADGEARESVPTGEAAAEIDERLVALLESLARTLSTGRRPGSGPGQPSAPLVVPVGPPRRDLLDRVAAEQDDEARSRAHHFLTYQEVLDRYGRPDHVWSGGRWVYVDPDTGQELEFRFEDGLLISIY